MGMQPWAYDYQSCPKRDGGRHEKDPDSYLCVYCHIRVVSVQVAKVESSELVVAEIVPDKPQEPEIARRGDWSFNRVPNYLRAEYRAACHQGMDDEYAQGYVAKQHGLEPGGRDTWTLRQLAKLEFLKWLAARETYES